MANEVAVKEEPICGIYMIINRLNGNQYVGQSIDIIRRYKEHLRPNTHGTKEFHNDIQTHGKRYFDLFILEVCNREMLNDREEYYIRKFQPYYNKSLGQGQKGLRISEKTRKLLSERAKNRWERMTDAQKEEVIDSMRRNHRTGYHLSDETKMKISAKRAGTSRSRESIDRQKQTIQEKKRAGYKRDFSYQYKQIVCTTTGKEFESLKEAAYEYGIYSADISNVLKGKQKTVHGLHFEYKEVKHG